MPLHLAHHKSYHPYSQENIQRVKRDEEEARLQQQEGSSRVRQAESDAQLDQLRRQRDGRNATDLDCGDEQKRNERPKQDHQVLSSRRRSEASRLEKEQQMGVYLGEIEREGPAWYGDPNLQGPRDRSKTEEQRIEDAYKDGVLKTSNDPLKAMSSFLAQREEARKRKAVEAENADPLVMGGQSSSGVSSYKHYVGENWGSQTSPSGRSEADLKQELNSRRRGDKEDFCLRPDETSAVGAQETSPMKGSPVGDDETAADLSTPSVTVTDANTTIPEGHTGEIVVKTEGIDPLDETPTTDHSILQESELKEEIVDHPRLDRDLMTMPQTKSAQHDAVTTETSDTAAIDSADAQKPTRSTPSPTPFGESMYPTLLSEMINIVLKDEAHLFDTSEVAVLQRYCTLPYESRYLFSRLIQRKDSWLRLEALRNAYSGEVGDLDAAVDCLTDSSLPRFLITHAEAGDDGQEAMLSLLTLEELKTLAKRMQAPKAGTTKSSIISALLTTRSQGTLASLFAPPSSPSKRKTLASSSGSPSGSRQLSLSFSSKGKKSSQSVRLANEVTKLLGPLIKVAPSTRSLLDRVALVFYRGAMLGGTALTTAVLARSRRRNYPRYKTQRSPDVFGSRKDLLAFEEAVAVENEMEELLQWGDGSEATFTKALKLFDTIWPIWKQTVSDFDAERRTRIAFKGIDRLQYHRMRFHAGWPQTRVVYKGTTILARFKMHDREEEVLKALLGQHYFRRGKRGEWYDRLALITAMYAFPNDKLKGKMEALKIAVAGIEDPDTHLIYHDQLQRRILRLENQLPIPKSQKHDFSYVKLRKCEERIFNGTRLDTMDDGASLDGQSLLAPIVPSKRAANTDKGVTGFDADGNSDSPQGSRFQARTPLRKVIRVERQLSPVKGRGRSGSASVTPGPALLKRSFSSSSDLLLPENAGGAGDQSPRSPGIDVSGLDEAVLAQYEVARKEKRTSMHSVWRGIGDGVPCRVEELVLQHYAMEGYTGLHDEGGLIKMLFALCMWDIIFASGSVDLEANAVRPDTTDAVANVTDVFETAYQRAPLDMDQDSFAITRAPLIHARLGLISSGAAARLVSEADDRERPRKTWAVGCRWDAFTKEQLVEVATLIPGPSLAVVFQMMVEEWGHCSGGMPDLIVWRSVAVPNQEHAEDAEDSKENQKLAMSESSSPVKTTNADGPSVKLCEVKGPGDRLSETQKVWIDVLLRAGIQVEVSLVREDENDPEVIKRRERERSGSKSPTKPSYVQVGRK
ncbi:unnamed protein product [Jaminaea pallidilutea]